MWRIVFKNFNKVNYEILVYNPICKDRPYNHVLKSNILCHAYSIFSHYMNVNYFIIFFKNEITYLSDVWSISGFFSQKFESPWLRFWKKVKEIHFKYKICFTNLRFFFVSIYYNVEYHGTNGIPCHYIVRKLVNHGYRPNVQNLIKDSILRILQILKLE